MNKGNCFPKGDLGCLNSAPRTKLAILNSYFKYASFDPFVSRGHIDREHMRLNGKPHRGGLYSAYNGPPLKLLLGSNTQFSGDGFGANFKSCHRLAIQVQLDNQ